MKKKKKKKKKKLRFLRSLLVHLKFDFFYSMGGSGGFVTGGAPLNTPLALFLLELLLVISLSRVIGAVLSYLNEPMVIAEIVAGIILGPSVLGQVPGFSTTVFPSQSVASLNIVAQWALVLFMFVVGLEQDTALWRSSARRAFFASIIGIVVAVVFGIPFAFATDTDEFHNTHIALYIVYIGLLSAVSALPVLARIMHEFDFLTTPLGVFTISVAAFEDLLAWPVLAMVTALASSTKQAADGQSSGIEVLWIVLLLIGYAVLLFVIVRPVLVWICRRYGSARSFNNSLGGIIILVLVAMALIAEIIGVTALVGAFIFGCIVPREGPTSEGLLERLQYVITTAFVPLYFAASGLRTEFGLLNSGRLWGMAVLLIVLSSLGKIVPSLLAGRFIARMSWLDASLFGILLNTKGLVALVTLNIGLDAEIITKELFAVSIVMVLFNTFLSGPLVSIVYRCVKKTSFTADNHNAKFGAEVSIIVAVGQAQPSVAGELARVASLLYGDQQDRAALHVWRVVDHLEADAAALQGDGPRRGLGRIPFLASTRRETDTRTKAAAVAAREANMKVSVKSQISHARLPEELCRIATEAKSGSIVLAANEIADLASESVEELVNGAPCDVVVVIPPPGVVAGGAVTPGKASEADDESSSTASASSSSASASSSSHSTKKHAHARKNSAPVGARIVVGHIGGVHDDLAVDIAIGAATSANPVLIIKCAQHAHHLNQASDSSSDEGTGAESATLTASDPNNPNDGLLLFDAQRRFLKRTMAGTHIDVLFRATEDDVAKEICDAMEQPIAPAVLLVGFSSPLLEVFAKMRAGWRTSIACANSPLAPTMGIARSNTIHTLHTSAQPQAPVKPRTPLADLFKPPSDDEQSGNGSAARDSTASDDSASSFQSVASNDSGSGGAADAVPMQERKKRRARKRNIDN
jgi:Kef-type K+ transport system membrane component KefB